MASTGLHGQNELNENGKFNHQPVSKLKTMSFDFQAGSMSRNSLQTLQFSSTSDKQLVGKDGPIKQRFNKASSKTHGSKHLKKSFIKPTNKPISFFMDPSPVKRAEDVNSNEEEAYQLMANEAVPESYWKLLAEERRSALDDSLHENEVLHKEIETLKEENGRLSEIAGQAEYLAEVLQSAIESPSEGEEEDSNDNKDKESEEKVSENSKDEVKHESNQSEDSDSQDERTTNHDHQDEKTTDQDGQDDKTTDQDTCSYLSSYDVISLTDENLHLSDVDDTSVEKDDSVTLCGSEESQNADRISVSPIKSFQSSDETARLCSTPVEPLPVSQSQETSPNESK